MGLRLIAVTVLTLAALVGCNDGTKQVVSAPMTPEEVVAIDAGWDFFRVLMDSGEPLPDEHRTKICEIYEDAGWNPAFASDAASGDEEKRDIWQLYSELVDFMKYRHPPFGEDDDGNRLVMDSYGDYRPLYPDGVYTRYEGVTPWELDWGVTGVAGYCAARGRAMPADAEIARIAADVWAYRLANYRGLPDAMGRRDLESRVHAPFNSFEFHDFSKLAERFREEYGAEPPPWLNQLLAEPRLTDEEINELLQEVLEGGTCPQFVYHLLC